MRAGIGPAPDATFDTDELIATQKLAGDPAEIDGGTATILAALRGVG